MKFLGKKKMGIYSLIIGEKQYIGKDHDIQRLKRVKQHLALLRKNEHWNMELQDDFNKGFPVSWTVLWETEDLISDEDLCQLEKKYILLEDSYSLGYNKTLGGIGGNGVRNTPEQLEAKSIRVSGDKNPMSKISKDDFLGIIEMLVEGYNNKEISERYHIHDRYVSLIRNKRRYKRWFEEYAPDYEIVSGRKFQKQNKLSDTQVIEIYKRYHNSNISQEKLAREYDVNPSTISLLVNKLTYSEVTADL